MNAWLAFFVKNSFQHWWPFFPNFNLLQTCCYSPLFSEILKLARHLQDSCSLFAGFTVKQSCFSRNFIAIEAEENLIIILAWCLSTTHHQLSIELFHSPYEITVVAQLLLQPLIT